MTTLVGLCKGLTDSQYIAGKYAGSINENKKTPSIYPVYLKINNPMNMDSVGNREDWINYVEKNIDFDSGSEKPSDIAFSQVKDGEKNSSYFKALKESMKDYQYASSYEISDELNKVIEGLGCDGITHEGGGLHANSDGTKHRVFVSFHDTSIKSALGNRGTFDTQDANIHLSRGDGSGTIALRDLKAVRDRVAERMSNLPPVYVLEEPRQAPKALRDHIEKVGAWNDVEGATHNGEIYLFASGLANEERAEFVLATHEITHYGLRGKYGEGMDAVLQHIWINNKEVRKAAAQLRENYGLTSNLTAVEEVLSDMPDEALFALKGWKRLVQALHNWMKTRGFNQLANKLNDYLNKSLSEQNQADLFVAEVLRNARDFVRKGKRGTGEYAAKQGTVLSESPQLVHDAMHQLTVLATSDAKENTRVEIAPVAHWVSEAIERETGVDVSSFKHTADVYAVRHIYKKHGDERSEVLRGQLPINQSDIENLPRIIQSADSIIIGLKNKRGQDLVFSIKQSPDGTAIVVEEVRTGKKSLALSSMRKVPSAKNAEELLSSVLLYVRNDTGDKPIVVNAPKEINQADGETTLFSRGKWQTDPSNNAPTPSPMQRIKEKAVALFNLENEDSPIYFLQNKMIETFAQPNQCCQNRFINEERRQGSKNGMESPESTEFCG